MEKIDHTEEVKFKEYSYENYFKCYEHYAIKNIIQDNSYSIERMGICIMGIIEMFMEEE